MITISLCMIVKNEENVLKRCLDSAKDIVDEIIIVDTGSTDKTKEIAKEYTDKIYDFEWINDFSAARNYAFSKATMDYQLFLDADDIFPEESISVIKQLKKDITPDIDLVTMKYVTHFDDQGNPSFIATRERLFKRSVGYLWEDPIHEVIPIRGKVLSTDICVHHKKEDYERTRDRNLNIYLTLEKEGHSFTPRQTYYFARELNDHGQHAKAAYYFELFLAGKQGWKEDNIASAFNLALIYERLGHREKILPVLTATFAWDSPRPEVCCQLGYYYKNSENYEYALKWFELALNLPKDNGILGFVLPEYEGYIPNLEACVAAYHLGKIELAIAYNEQAATYKETEAIKINRKFFEELVGLN